MTPIHELLSRIRWDKEFGQGQFEIGYYDRHEDMVCRIAFTEITFPEEVYHAFELVDDVGQRHRIPLHRVREVYKDGKLIWQRPER